MAAPERVKAEAAASLKAATNKPWREIAEITGFADLRTARRAALRAVDAQEREGQQLVEEARRLRAAIRSGGDR